MVQKDFIDRLADAHQRDDLAAIRTWLSSQELTPLVGEVLGSQDLKVLDWDFQPLKRGIGGSQVFKVSGHALVGGHRNAWSIVLKTLNKSGSTQAVSGDDWCREALAYRSGLLDELPGGLEAATCYRLDDRSESEIWMWLEDLSGAPDVPWSLERFGLAARHLGQLNGHYCTHPWPEASLLDGRE